MIKKKFIKSRDMSKVAFGTQMLTFRVAMALTTVSS